MKGNGRIIDPNGRFVIPAEMRCALNLNPGDSISVQQDGQKIILEKIICHCKICGSAEHLNSQFGICQKCIGDIKKT